MKRLPYKHPLTAYNGIKNWFYNNKIFRGINNKKGVLNKGIESFLKSKNITIHYRQPWKKRQASWEIIDCDKNSINIRLHFNEFAEYLINSLKK